MEKNQSAFTSLLEAIKKDAHYNREDVDVIFNLLEKADIDVPTLRNLIEADDDNPGLIKEMFENAKKRKPRQETFADENGKLTFRLLLSYDRLINAESKEVFEIKDHLPNNPLCSAGQEAFRIKLVDRQDVEMVIICNRLKTGHLQLTGFEKHIPRHERTKS